MIILQSSISYNCGQKLNIKTIIKKMLLEGAIGDAYGAGFEFAEQEIVKQENDLTRYRPHPLFSSIFKKYTDDTQMSIGIIELLLEGRDWTVQNLADKFVTVFKRDIREGYAKRFYQLMTEVDSGEELLKKIIPKSERNGAAMRAYPIGILDNELEIIEKTAIQASVTHQTEPAIISAQAIALTSHFFIYNKGSKKNLLEYLAHFQQKKWSANWQGRVKIDGIQTVEAVLTILLEEKSLANILKKSVDFGGDVDTVASLGLAIASQSEEYEQNLPQWLFDNLENGAYGRDYLTKLDRDFMDIKK